MNKPILLPCLLTVNHKEIEQAEKLGLPVPEEIVIKKNIRFYKVDIVEPCIYDDEESGYKIQTYVFVSGSSYCCTASEEEIEKLMIEAGWYD